MFYVYLIQSLTTKEIYKGLTNDLKRRLKEHFDGQSPSTKNKLPIRLIHVEICTDRIEARKMEKFFKSGYGREAAKEIVEALDNDAL